MASPPRPPRPLSARVKTKLRRLARANSERFARSMITTLAALEDPERNDGAAGVEFVESLNGIDVYEDVTHAAHLAPAAAARLRSFCHLEADIQDVVRRLAPSPPSSASPHRVMPGVVETHELVSVLAEPTATKDREFSEHAGVNWFALSRDPARDSVDSWSSDTPPVEFLVLAYQGIFKHRGRRGWVQWCQSIELAGFGECETPRGVLFSSGIVAVESASRRGHVSVGYAMGLDLSGCDATERRCLEHAVWTRVLRLAALKKATLRDSWTRTVSMTSADSVEQDLPVLPEEKTNTNNSGLAAGKPPTHCSEPVAGRPLVKPVKDKRRVRAQTMEPTPSPRCYHEHDAPRRHHVSLFREPTSLEFRLTLYRDPEDECIAVLEDSNHHTTTMKETMATTMATATKEPKPSLFAMIFRTNKPTRSKAVR